MLCSALLQKEVKIKRLSREIKHRNTEIEPPQNSAASCYNRNQKVDALNSKQTKIKFVNGVNKPEIKQSENHAMPFDKTGCHTKRPRADALDPKQTICSAEIAPSKNYNTSYNKKQRANASNPTPTEIKIVNVQTLSDEIKTQPIVISDSEEEPSETCEPSNDGTNKTENYNAPSRTKSKIKICDVKTLAAKIEPGEIINDWPPKSLITFRGNTFAPDDKALDTNSSISATAQNKLGDQDTFHKTIHTETATYTCNVCNIICTTRCNFKRHLWTHCGSSVRNEG